MEETGGCLLRGCGLTVANAEAERPPQYYDYGVDHLGAPAVSEETAVEIAAPARGMVSATNVVVSTTGIARPSGGTLDRGVGTVSAWVGLGNQDRGAALPAVEIQGLGQAPGHHQWRWSVRRHFPGLPIREPAPFRTREGAFNLSAVSGVHGNKEDS